MAHSVPGDHELIGMHSDEEIVVQEAHREENAAGPNLCGKEVTTRNFISQFLHSKDVPVVKVQKSPSKYILSQLGEKYAVPLFISNGWNETLIWLLPNNSLCHPDANSTDILITNQTLAFNYKYQSFARFEYDDNVYSRYLKSIHKMDDVTVFNILMDFRESLGTEMFINLAAAAVQTKRTSLVWKVIVDYVYEKFDDVSIPKPLKKPIRRLERHFLWKESSNLVIRQLQNEVSSFLVDAEVGEAVEKAYKLFQTNFSSCKSNLWSCNRIPADLRPAVYCAAIKSDSKNLKFFKNYQKSLSQISLIPQAFESELSAIDYAFNCQ
ncbi:unnamed protein product [Bursaphelenchus xylophilus]|uniref:(pine wood nematode) hypothetical protein n=1 Tax=Bursaphelenchus xylophilus TaxID=6326 RepID=A0A7I8WH65_BURXY|nr:unnamed protein product [Bursaphelenchus xylophilus]CAG9110162.1 unnamed protein product [Bursaphelenchus xylophilus]